LQTFTWLDHGFGTRTPPDEPLRSATVKQIHSNLILTADSNGSCVGEGDGLITAEPGATVSVRTADCYPILMADPVRRSVAAIHAGWRGTAEHIVEKALVRLKTEFGTEPRDVAAAIGPGIGVCCYEVGEDVASRFGFSVRTHLDLAAENRKQLEAAGVPPGNIEALGACTFCYTERFFSYRREKEKAGRMVSFIRITSLDRREITPR
jgi:YfiH family protein